MKEKGESVKERVVAIEGVTFKRSDYENEQEFLKVILKEIHYSVDRKAWDSLKPAVQNWFNNNIVNYESELSFDKFPNVKGGIYKEIVEA